MMFLYNRGYFNKITGVHPDGVILNASLVMEPQLSRRELSFEQMTFFLFDPQFYLIDIDYTTCTKIFKNLSTYPWFNPNPPKYKSEVFKLNEFKKQLTVSAHSISYPGSDKDKISCIKKCLDFQAQIGCSHLIIPSPIVRTREEQFTEQIKWARIGAQLKKSFDEPCISTIAITDTTLSGIPFKDNLVTQTILDYMPIIDEIDGYYIVIERDNTSISIKDKEIARTLLELSYIFSKHNKMVIINFADAFGLVCLAVGATAFGSGYSNKEKRLCLEDFCDRGGGKQFPKFYSNSLIGDFFSERDINKLKKAKLEKYIFNDITKYSSPLIEALKKGSTAHAVPDWEESINNVTFASRHRVESLVKQAHKLNSFVLIEDKLDYIYSWLKSAQSWMEDINKHKLEITEDGLHVDVWKSALEDFRNDNSI